MKSTTRSFAVLAIAALGSLPALANDGLRPVFGAAVTSGGEKLATVRFTDGSTENIKSGGLIHLFGGVEYRSGAFALQANVGYHVEDTSAASNGSVKFSRMPIEVLGFWHLSDSWRFGGGFRKAGSAKLTGSGAAASVGSFTFTGKGGLVLQGETFFGGSQASAYLRYVTEDYELRGVSVSGNHVGLGFAFRF